MNVKYQEFQPSAVLQPFVDCFWYKSFESDSPEEYALQSCLPLGTAEIIFLAKGNYCHVYTNDQWQLLPHAYVVGIYKDTVLWKATGNVLKFGIRLKPESFLQLFKIPAASLFNTFTELDLFFGREINRLADQIFGQSNIDTLIHIAETFLQNQLRHMKAERNYALEASQLIRLSKGSISIESLSENVFISKRQLERSFKDYFGTSPKTYLRIIRFRNAYQYVQQVETTPRWIDVTHNFGYADQAHFIRDFKEFTGDVPTSLLQKGQHFYQLSRQPA